jgi:hypothetical protein
MGSIVRVGVGMLLLLATSCATAPIEATRAFDDAVTAVKGAGDTILDEMSVAERRNYLAKSPHSKLRFYVQDAPYIATIGEPPATAMFRHSLDLVKKYSQLIRSFAEGNNTEEARGQLLSIASTIGQLTKFAQLAPAAGQLSSVIDEAIRLYDIGESKRLVVEGAPLVKDVLTRLRNSTGTIFETIVADAKLTGNPRFSLEAERVRVANFVVLLDQLQAALDRMVVAYLNPTNAVTLADLAKATGELNADVTAARKAFATLSMSK